MIELIERILSEECLLTLEQPLLVGVSGGPDSLCLLDLLSRTGYNLIVAHLDHGLRAESADEAKSVKQFAHKIGASFCLGVKDVELFSKTQALSIEEAARTLRYQFLFEQARETGAQAVAVGHTADDQVETVLMHMLRGAGLSGLKGMTYYSLPNPWSKHIPLVRPLLGVWREEIIEYIADCGLQPIFDPSNLDTRLYRNRLRHELIPLLESYNPGFRQRTLQMAHILSDDHAVLETVANNAWQACVLSQGAGYIELDVEGIRLLPVGLQRQVLRQAIQELRPGLRNVDFAAVERARHFLENPPSTRKSDLAAGLYLQLEKGKCWLAGWDSELPTGNDTGWPRISSPESIDLATPGTIQLWNGWQLSAEPVDIQMAIERGMNNTDPFQVWMDAENIIPPLHVRTRRPGDRFQPLGMDGHSIKLSDLMINAKLPVRARANWPLVLSGDAIVWVPGLRPGYTCRLTESSKNAVHIKIFHPNKL
jgi:tRNA(Ile)-lysidine synthase